MSSALQRDLPLCLVKPEHANVQLLIETLRARGGWMHACSILEQWGWPDSDNNRRVIRGLSEMAIIPPADDGDTAEVLIISGQFGYKHIEHATPEEASHAAAWLEAQAKKMGDRARGIRKAMHRRIG